MRIIAIGSTSFGVHCIEAWPPRASVVTSKSFLPNFRFIGEVWFSVFCSLEDIIYTILLKTLGLLSFARALHAR